MKILLADDHDIVREGLRHLVERETDMNVSAMADTGRLAVKLAAENAPDVVIMDLTMPEMNGIEATRRIVAATPQLPVIILSMHSDRKLLMEAFAAGARGYLLKDNAAEELVGAIRSVAANETYISPKVAGVVIHDYLHRSVGESSGNRLSSREREVLQLVAEGKNSKEIAFILNLSTKTVETHRHQIMKKLNLRSIADLTKYALREGLTTL